MHRWTAGTNGGALAPCDGLSGPAHQVRHSLHYVPWKERKIVAAALRRIYTAPNVDQAERELSAFESSWGEKYPRIGPSWRNNWHRLSVFFDYPPQIRKVIYTTNAVESLNASLQ